MPRERNQKVRDLRSTFLVVLHRMLPLDIELVGQQESYYIEARIILPKTAKLLFLVGTAVISRWHLKTKPLLKGFYVRDLASGVTDPNALASHRHPRYRASEEEIAAALTGVWRQPNVDHVGS